MEDGGSDFDPAAAKAALEIIRGGLRERSLRRKEPAGDAGAASSPSVQEQSAAEEELPPEDTETSAATEQPKRTILESFVPRLVREATAPQQPVKRGPGRPRKH